MSNSVPINSVVASFHIIELMAEAGGPVSITFLANAMGTNKPRIHRHLKTLALLGYVRQDQSSLYFLTSKIRYISRASHGIVELLSIARPHLIELRDKTRQTVTVGEVEADGIRNLEILRGGGAVEITSTPGSFFEFYCSAQGKVALAYDETGQLLNVARRRAELANSTCDFNKLQNELEAVKERGWAVAPGEVIPGINALAAPVFDGVGELAGTISILGSTEHVAPTPSDTLIEDIQNASRKISSELTFKEKVA
ncbi:IclR family transcriptional regulator [Hyphococcus formosus]|uniref:IclR family transcriptional regulator n=1 Tax=Hyphococcus formosus TaxID=3143534 RepID=UPI00398A613F